MGCPNTIGRGIYSITRRNIYIVLKEDRAKRAFPGALNILMLVNTITRRNE
jgi:hypothetical protein